MGNSQNKSNLDGQISEECKKDYFRYAKKDFSEGIKKIHSTIHITDEISSNNEDNWVDYLIDKLNEYLKKKKLNNKYILQIINYLKNTEDSREVKHVYNLSIFLSQEMEDITKSMMHKQSIIDKFYPEEDYKNNKNSLCLSKDEMLWKGSEFIFKDIEDINHPIYDFVKNLNFILTEVYEKEYHKILNNLENNIDEYKYHSDILIENSDILKLRNSINYKTSQDNVCSTKENKFLKTNSSIGLSENKQIIEFYNAIHSELILFSTFLAGSIIRFYSIKNSTSTKLFEIFVEKMKDLLIRKDLYKFIYKLKSKINKRRKEKYSKSLLDFYNIKPHYLCTSPYFSQDKTFRRFIKEFIKQNNKKNLNKDSKMNLHFQNSILLFRQINDNDSIIRKIDIMYQLRASILNEIDNFWIGIPLKPKYKSVDADNLLSIFIYLMIKSQIDNLIIDLDIIDDFTNRVLKLSRKGYFFSLFQSSVDYLIENLSLSQLDINIKEYNNIVNKEISLIESDPESILDFKNLSMNDC